MYQIEGAFGSIKLAGGSCAAGAALTTCKSSLFASARSGAAMVLVVMIAGKSTDDVSAGAGALKGMKVKTIAVGMGAKFEQSQLTAMAWEASYVITASSFSQLTSIQGQCTSLISSGKFKLLSSEPPKRSYFYRYS